MAENPLIEIRQLRFRRGDRVIFDGVDIDIPRGKVTALLGPSGTGKTTLLRMIGGQLRPDRGSIRFDGAEIPAMSRNELFKLRSRLGMLFQSGALFTDISVFENVAFPLRVHADLSPALLRTLVLMKLEAVGLRGAAELMPAELSGGMARRVALARAIACDPEFIMYDEPFTGQDPVAMGMLVKLLRGLNRSLGLTTLLVSHDIHETMDIADQVVIIADGRVVAAGAPAELRASDDPRVQQFIAGSPDGPIPFHYPAARLRDTFRHELY
jgi:phospholipid/cholesterol/gamma-HCH transport system ATP-binding protein